MEFDAQSTEEGNMFERQILVQPWWHMINIQIRSQCLLNAVCKCPLIVTKLI